MLFGDCFKLLKSNLVGKKGGNKMGMVQGIAILVTIVGFLFIPKMAENAFERMEKELEEEKKGCDLLAESEQTEKKY